MRVVSEATVALGYYQHAADGKRLSIPRGARHVTIASDDHLPGDYWSADDNTLTTVVREYAAENLYRAEKAKRGLNVALPAKLGPVSDAKLRKGELRCKVCRSLNVAPRARRHSPTCKPAAKRTWHMVVCTDCGWQWRTTHCPPLHGPTRQVEVRG